jgi:hypothetical protein
MTPSLTVNVVAGDAEGTSKITVTESFTGSGPNLEAKFVYRVVATSEPALELDALTSDAAFIEFTSGAEITITGFTAGQHLQVYASTAGDFAKRVGIVTLTVTMRKAAAVVTPGGPAPNVNAEYCAASETITVDGAPTDVFFYALRFSAEKADKTRWIPIFGGQSIVVTRSIPRPNATADAIIPIVNAEQRALIAAGPATTAWTNNTTNNTAGQLAVAIPKRGEALTKDQVKLDLTKEDAAKLLNGVAIGDVEFRTAATGVWADLTVAQINLFTNPDLFPTGGTLQIRRKATATAAAPLRGINVRIAAQGKEPNASWEAGKSTMKGFNAKNHEVLLPGATEWVQLTANTTVAWRNLINGDTAGGATTAMTVEVRVKAGNRPHSAARSVDIPIIAAVPATT